MLKIKENVIKTMADDILAATNKTANNLQEPVSSTAIVLLNKKLRAGFGFSTNIKSGTILAPIKNLSPKQQLFHH